MNIPRRVRRRLRKFYIHNIFWPVKYGILRTCAVPDCWVVRHQDGTLCRDHTICGITWYGDKAAICDNCGSVWQHPEDKKQCPCVEEPVVLY